MTAALGFHDHHRQRYSEAVRIAEAGEFTIGDYLADGSIAEDGGFAVALVELPGSPTPVLHPRLSAFGDGAGALRRAIGAGLLDALAPASGSEEFSRRLIALGFTDLSDRPLPAPGETGRGPR